MVPGSRAKGVYWSHKGCLFLLLLVGFLGLSSPFFPPLCEFHLSFRPHCSSADDGTPKEVVALERDGSVDPSEARSRTANRRRKEEEVPVAIKLAARKGRELNNSTRKLPQRL